MHASIMMIMMMIMMMHRPYSFAEDLGARRFQLPLDLLSLSETKTHPTFVYKTQVCLRFRIAKAWKTVRNLWLT